MLWDKALKYWKSLVVFAIISYLSLLRESDVVLPSISGVDKLIHLAMYMVLTWVLIWDSLNAEIKGWRWMVVTMLLPASFGGLIEILQDKFFYPRTGDWQDWAADCVGVLVACAIWWIVGLIKKNVRGVVK